MFRGKPAAEATRIGRYWDNLVTGADEGAYAAIDPTFEQTIAWLERVDDAQPASAEFARRFERQFLQSIDAARGTTRPSSIPQPPSATPQAPSGRRGSLSQSWEKEGGFVTRPAETSDRARVIERDNRVWRFVVPLLAAVLLVVSLVAIYAVLERREGARDSNVILAPSTAVDVPMDRGNAQRTGEMPGPGISGDLGLLWSSEAGRDGISAPAVVGDTIFVTSGSDPIGESADQGAVIAIDATTGEERWRMPVEHAMGATPAVVGGIVYAGDAGGVLYALDARTGEERWRQVLPSGWMSEPVVVGDAVFIAAATTQAPLHLAVADGTLVVGSGFVGQAADGFRLYAFDRLTGAERWQSGDDQSGQPGLFAFRTDDGGLVWQFAMASLESGPAIANGAVFAGSTLDRTIFALELGSGAEVWQADIGVDLPLNTSPAVSGGRVFVTTAFGTIFCLDEVTGEVCWQAHAEHASLNSSPVVVGSTVYVVDTAYGVSVFSTTDGGVFWSQQLELTGQVVVSPVVVNGRLFIGTSLNANSAYAATLWALAGSDEG